MIKYSGVTYDKSPSKIKRWRARIYQDGRVYFVGRYKTQEEAIEAHKKRKEELNTCIIENKSVPRGTILKD